MRRQLWTTLNLNVSLGPQSEQKCLKIVSICSLAFWSVRSLTSNKYYYSRTLVKDHLD